MRITYGKRLTAVVLDGQLQVYGIGRLGQAGGCDFHTAFVHQHCLEQSGVRVEQAQKLVRLPRGIVGGIVLRGTTSG